MFEWINKNEGIISLLAILATFPAAFIAVYRAVRKFYPSCKERQISITRGFAHAEALKKDVENNTEWNKLGGYDIFLIRDTGRRLPHSSETHSPIESRYIIARLVEIHNEYLDFSMSVCCTFIKMIADCWHTAKEGEDEAIGVETIVRIHYRDIALIRWEPNDYWEWPQICCGAAFSKALFRRRLNNRFFKEYVFFAQWKRAEPEFYYKRICSVAEVTDRPSVLIEN